VSTGHQHVGSVRQVGHGGRVCQALGVVRLVVVIWKVVEHVARVVGGRQTLSVRDLPSQIVRHLGLVRCGQVIQGRRCHIATRCETKHCLETAVMCRSRGGMVWSWCR